MIVPNVTLISWYALNQHSQPINLEDSKRLFILNCNITFLLFLSRHFVGGCWPWGRTIAWFSIITGDTLSTFASACFPCLRWGTFSLFLCVCVVPSLCLTKFTTDVWLFLFMWVCLQTAGFQETLTEMEILALIVGCICHDLDHRGTNNAFQAKWESITATQHYLELNLNVFTAHMSFEWIWFHLSDICVFLRTGSALSLLYGTSATLEHHHFNHAVMILQSEVDLKSPWNQNWQFVFYGMMQCLL